MYKEDNNYIEILSPKGLDIEALIKANKPNFPFHIGYCSYIISLIIERSSYDHRLLEVEAFPYVQLSAKRLNEVVTHYQHYLYYLCDVGVLECDQTYKPKAKCLGYPLTAPYRTEATISQISGIDNPKLLIKRQKSVELINKPALERYSNLIQWFDYLEFDSAAATEYTEKAYTDKLALASTDTEVSKAVSEYNAHLAMIKHFLDPNPTYTVDKAGHRFHSKLTNLWSPLRKFLTLRDNKLVSVDLSNSQPYIATRLFYESFYSDQSDNGELVVGQMQSDVHEKLIGLPQIIWRIKKRNQQPIELDLNNLTLGQSMILSVLGAGGDSISPSTLNYEMRRLSLMLEILDDTHAFDQEVASYTDSVQTGQFYERLGEEWSYVTHRPVPCRDKLKEIVISTLYSDNEDRRPNVVKSREMFNQVYPYIYGLFAELKARSNSDLAILLQALEAEIFLNRIAARISHEAPQLPIFTIHDSLITIDGYEEYIRKVMHEELLKATGVIPHFKTEKWCIE